ncbi:hypothetical protein MSPP1_001663 [Malassezia sp. CBS 17886]|nr:hypothetical protein MSPP1_001663 [Malassezia sp. CBS 17886]
MVSSADVPGAGSALPRDAQATAAVSREVSGSSAEAPALAAATEMHGAGDGGADGAARAEDARTDAPEAPAPAPAPDARKRERGGDNAGADDNAADAPEASVRATDARKRERDGDATGADDGASDATEAPAPAHEPDARKRGRTDTLEHPPSTAGAPGATAQNTRPQHPNGTKGPSLGFGAFAARVTPFKTAGAAGAEHVDTREDWTKSTDAAPEVSTTDNVVRKRSLRLPDTELTTGEEDENTVCSARTKLYYMTKDQSWKERGTGVLKLNVPAPGAADGAARLVMRSDAVLRVILNVKLFPGMQCDLEQEQFLRLVAMEDDAIAHFAIKDAATFLVRVRDHIPARSEGD